MSGSESPGVFVAFGVIEVKDGPSRPNPPVRFRRRGMFNSEVEGVIADDNNVTVPLSAATSLVIAFAQVHGKREELRSYTFGQRRRGAPQIDTMRITPSWTAK